MRTIMPFICVVVIHYYFLYIFHVFVLKLAVELYLCEQKTNKNE